LSRRAAPRTSELLTQPLLLLIVLLLFGAHPALSQTIEIDTRVPNIAPPPPLDVRNRDAVGVRIHHLPILQCKIDTKAEPLREEPNPILTILQAASKIFAGGAVSRTTSCPTPIAPPSGDQEARRIETQLGRLAGVVDTLISDPQKYYERHEALVARIRAFSRCQLRDGSPACDPAQFEGHRKALETDLNLFLDDVPPSTDAAAFLVEVLKKSLGARLATDESTPDGNDWLSNAVLRLECYARAFERVLERRKIVLASREEMRKALETLVALRAARVETVVQLRREHESRVTATATCTNRFTKEVDVPAINFVITYHDRPALFVSAGLAYSTGDKRTIGSQAVRTGVDSNGAVTFRNEIAETDSAEYQVVPFTFLSWMPLQGRHVDVGVAAGIGLNANNGGKQVECMVGPSVGYRNVYVVVGVHRLRRPEPGGGFSEGDVLPSGFPGVPIRRDVRNVLAVALTYKLPF
jgi:hypothetical protein